MAHRDKENVNVVQAPTSRKRAETSDHSHCCVPECTSDKRYDIENKLSFHAFPTETSRKQEWIHKIRRDPGKYFKVSKPANIPTLPLVYIGLGEQ